MVATKELTKKRNYIKEFKEAYISAHNGLLEAAKIYVEAIDADWANRELFQKELNDFITPPTWQKLEAIGRKTVDPKLLLGMGGKHTGKIKKLPYSLQKAILSNQKFEYLTSSDSKLKIDLMNCTDEQAKQIFANDHIRSLPEQKAWIESEKTKVKENEVEHYLPFEFRKEGIYFKEGTLLTHDEAKRLLLQLLG